MGRGRREVESGKGLLGGDGGDGEGENWVRGRRRRELR